MKANAGM